MKVMNTVDYLNATEKKAPAASNDMFALLMQMAKPFTSSYREVR